MIVKKVIAVQDRDKHNGPPYAFGIVKIIYLCESTGGSFTENIETTESAYFDENSLPALSLARCSEDQIHLCFRAYEESLWEAQFD